MPHGDETAHTLQLWLNLPAKMKMIPARYQDQRLKDTAVRKLEGGEVRVYAGRATWPRGVYTRSRFPLCARGPRTNRRHRGGEGRRCLVRTRRSRGSYDPGYAAAAGLVVQRRADPRAGGGLRTVRHEHHPGDPAGVRRLSDGADGSPALKSQVWLPNPRPRTRSRSIPSSSISRRSLPTAAWARSG